MFINHVFSMHLNLLVLNLLLLSRAVFVGVGVLLKTFKLMNTLVTPVSLFLH